MAPNQLSELAPIAETLNKESNEVNTLIASLNEELRALNFGISVWLPNPSKADPSCTLGFTDTCEVEHDRDGNWIKPSKLQLAFRFFDDMDGIGNVERSLLKAPRNLRIEGLQEVPTILRMLKEEAESRISAIRQAKQLVAELSAKRKAES